MSPKVTQTEIEMLLGADSTDQGIGETLGLLRESMAGFIRTFEAITGVTVHRGDGEALIRVNPEGNATVVDGTYEKTIRLRGVHPTDEITAWYTELLNDIETVEDTETMRTFDAGVRCVASQWADPSRADVEREQMKLYQLGDETPVTTLPMEKELVVGGDVTFEPIEPPRQPQSVGDVDPASYVEDRYQEYDRTARESDSTVEITASGETDTAAHSVDFETAMYMRSQSDGDKTAIAEVVDYEADSAHDRVTVTLVLPDGSAGTVVGAVGAEEDSCETGEVPFEKLCQQLYNPDAGTWVDLEHVERLVGAVGMVRETDGGYELDTSGQYRETLSALGEDTAKAETDTNGGTMVTQTASTLRGRLATYYETYPVPGLWGLLAVLVWGLIGAIVLGLI